MEKLIIEGHVTNENKVFKLFIKHFECRDTRHVIYDLLISLNDGQAADWVTYCDKICIKYRTTSVPSGAILEYAFTVYDLSNPSEYAPDTAMCRINQSKLSAFSDIVLAIVKAYDANCNNTDIDEGNQEDRYTITIANRGKELYKGGLNSGADFNNAIKYITKSIIHEALEKFRVFPYKEIRVTVEDNILGKTYAFCVCGKTNIDNISEYSAIKTNIRFINFMNSSIKYDDSDFAAKTMITRLCTIVMQIAGAIENNYGLPNNKDKDEAKLVYEEEEETDAIPEEKPIQFSANVHGGASGESKSYCCYLMPDGTVKYSVTNVNSADDCDLSCSIIEAFSMFNYATVDVGKVKFSNGTEYNHAAFTLWDRFIGKETAEYMVLSLKDRFNNFCKRLKNDADDCDEMNEVILRFANAFIRNLHEVEEKMEPSPFDHFDILRNHMNILQDYSSGFATREPDYAIIGLVILDRTNYDHELTDKDNIVGMHNAFTNATNLSFCSANNIHKCYAISTCAMLYVYYDKRNIGPIYLWGGPNDESLTTLMNRLYIFAARGNDDIPVPCMYNIMVYCRAFITDFIQGAANTNNLCKGARKELLYIIRTLELSDCL